MLQRVLLADSEESNLAQLNVLFKDLYNTFPSIYSGNISSLYEFILNDENGVVFIRIDDTSIDGLELSRKAHIWYPRIQVVWMSRNGNYTLDAFTQGIDAYLQLPASQEKLLQVVENLQLRKITL